MSLDKAITASAKKEYKDFEKEVAKEVETKMKAHLSGFTDFLHKTAFKKED